MDAECRKFGIETAYFPQFFVDKFGLFSHKGKTFNIKGKFIMSSTTKDDGKKWIQASVAVACMMLGYVLIRFFLQLGEWFELESKVNNFGAITQVLAVLISGGVFMYIMRNPITSTFLKEVYQEAVKVVWPDKNETVKHTIIIMIGVTIVGFLLGVFDWVSKWLLGMIH